MSENYMNVILNVVLTFLGNEKKSISRGVIAVYRLASQ